MIPERLLLGPGPSPVTARVMRAMANPVLSHLDPEMMRILDGVRGKLARVFGAGADAFTFAASGTGTSGMEAAVANVTSPGARVLVVVTGYFGAGWPRSSRVMAPTWRVSRSSGGGPATRRLSNDPSARAAPTSWRWSTPRPRPEC
jgi:aspartate aminotransferase-like enzyme